MAVCSNSQQAAQLASVSAGNAFIWDADSGEKVRSIGEGYDFNSIAWSLDGSKIAGGLNKAITIWDSESGKLVNTYTEHQSQVASIAWSPDGCKLASGDTDGTLIIWDLENGQWPQVQENLSGPSNFDGWNPIDSIYWSPNGLLLAIGTAPNKIIIWDLNKSEKLFSLSGYTDSVSWSPDGKMIAYTSDRGGKPQIYLMPVQGGKAKRLTYEGRYNARPVFSPDGKSIAMIHGQGGDYRIAVLGLESRVLQVLTKGRLDESPSFAPNGSMILYAAKKGDRGLLSAVSADGRVHQKLVMRGGEVRDPAWSPN